MGRISVVFLLLFILFIMAKGCRNTNGSSSASRKYTTTDTSKPVDIGAELKKTRLKNY